MMRLAIISDVHGNLVALEAVLAEITQQHIEHIICLGDVAALGPQPQQTLVRLQALGCPVVMGNTDDALLKVQQTEEHPSIPDRMRDIFQWGAQQLSESDKTYLRSFQSTITQPLTDGKTLLAYHGSPRSYNEHVHATTPEDELEQIFAGVQAQIMVGGHSHLQLFRRYRDSLLLNAGSVGLPRDRVEYAESRHPAWAEYIVITSEGSALNVELRRTPFDIHAFFQTVRASGMPHAEWYAGEWDLS